MNDQLIFQTLKRLCKVLERQPLARQTRMGPYEKYLSGGRLVGVLQTIIRNILVRGM
jgi:hypothetical protein